MPNFMRNLATKAHIEASEVQKTILFNERSSNKIKIVKFKREIVLEKMGSSDGLKVVVTPKILPNGSMGVENVTIESYDATVPLLNTQFSIEKDVIKGWFLPNSPDSEMKFLVITVCRNKDVNFPLSIIFQATKGETGGPGPFVKLPTPE